VTAACRLLGLTQPTISKQVGDLEDALGEPLFRRAGRRLVLTDVGRTAYAYADDMFSLGQELLDVMRGRASGKPIRLHVGVSDVVPKLLTRLVLEPALRMDRPLRLVCTEGKPDRLLADLALGGLDAVITDAPPVPGSRIRVFSHRLGENPVGVYAPVAISIGLRRRFPQSLDGAPMLMPTESSALRRSIEAWLEEHRVYPRVVAEFEDSALLKAFAAAGHGCFFAPLAVQRELKTQFDFRLVRRVEGMFESMYVVTAERRVSHPGVAAIVDGARAALAE